MSAAPSPTVASSADAFVQSIGVNVHMAYTWTPYANVTAVEAELTYLDVAKVRDVFWPAGLNSFNQLAAFGTKIDFILPVYQPSTINLSQFTTLLDSFVQAHPGSISAIEGPNEVNIQPGTFNGGTTPADEAALQAALFAAVKNDSNLAEIPVYALTIGSGSASAFQPYGNLSPYANYANAHSYLPDDSTPQSALQDLLPIQAGIDTPGLPIVITETGWTTDPGFSYNGADQTTQAKLTLDALVDAFKDGVSSTYLYELIDEAPDPEDANSEDHFGLFNYDGTPKAAAEALHNLTSILADSGGASSFVPGALSYALPNLPSNGNQLLLQKSSGTFDLVLWAETPIWNGSAATEIAAQDEATILNFATTQKVVLLFDPLLGSAPIAAFQNVQSISLLLTDHPVIVEIPASNAGLAAPSITGYAFNSSGSNSGTLTGTAEANSTVLLFDGTTEIGSAIANASGAWTFSTGTLAKGANALTAIAVDMAGDASALSTALIVTNVSGGPAAPITAPVIVNDTITSTNQVILTGTGEANSKVSVFDTTLIGTTTVNASGVWTFTTPALVNGDNNFAVITTDASGNTSAASNYVEPTINLAGPTATSVTVSGTGITTGSGDLGIGHVVTFAVAMSENVTVSGGTPTLTLNDGGVATYSGGSGGNVLTFSYTVAAGQNTPALEVAAVNVNGATITDAGDSNAVLAGTLMIAGTLQIDTSPPSAPVISGDQVNPNNSVTLSGTAEAGSTVTVYDNGTELGTTVANGTSSWNYTSAVLGSGTYNFTSTATDAAGNTSVASNPVAQTVGQTSGPAITSVASSGTGISLGMGDLSVGHVITLTLSMSEAVVVTGGTPTLTLNDGGIATFSGGSGTDELTFSYTVSAGQNTSRLMVAAVNLNSANMTDSAGNAADLSLVGLSQAGPQIDTSAPTITSLAQSPAGGDLGTGKTVTFTLTLSEVVMVTGGTPALILNDGGTATYVSGSGTNSLAFSYKVGGGQSTSALAATSVNLNSATISDGAGNAANLSLGGLSQNGPEIDTSTPRVVSLTESPSGGDLGAGKAVTFTLAMSEIVTVIGGTPTLTLNDGGIATYENGSGTATLTFSYTVAVGQSTSSLAANVVNVNAAIISDGAGNAANLSLSGLSQSGPQIDTTRPTISSIAESPASGELGAGKNVTFTLAMSEIVTVAGGTPTLTLNDGGIATYVSGSGTTTLTFSYTAAVGQSTSSLGATAVNLNTATVSDGAGNAANLSLSGLSQSGPQIDTTRPTILSLAESPAIGELGAGKAVTFTLAMSEIVTVAGGAPTLTLNDGGTATYVSGSGTNTLTFSYTVAAGQSTSSLAATAVNLNTAAVSDGAGNAANLSLSGLSQSGPQIDTTRPTISSLAESPASGDLDAGRAVMFSLAMTEIVTVAGGTPTLTLNDGGTATFVSGSGTNTLTFSYTVGAGQSTSSLAATAVNLNTAIIADGAGNTANLSLSGLSQNGPQIDTTRPTISSLAESPASGDLGAGRTVTLTLVMSEIVTVAGGAPTLTLNDGGTATYVSGSGTNTLTFSYTVGAGQNIASLAATAVNVNTATISDGAGNAANLSLSGLSQNGPQIDTTAPAAPVIASDTINDNNSVTVTGTAAANSIVTLYDGLVALGTTTASATGAWSYTTSILGSGAQTFTATVTDVAGNTSPLSNSVDPIISISLATQIAEIYTAILQRAPSSTEATASIAIDSTSGNTGMIAGIVDSTEAITNVYPVLQMFDLAFGHFPSAATLASMVGTGLTLPQLAAAVVGSQAFANTYTGGTLINPNSAVTAGIVEALYSQALGHAPAPATLNGWLTSGLTVAQAFLAMVTSQSYFATSLPAIEQYLTAAATASAGYANVSINVTAADLTATQVSSIYEAVLQRAPTATEVTAAVALDTATGDVGVITALVNSVEATTNVYPILQMFDLALGYFPGAATLASMVETGLTVPQLASAVVASQAFANTYNGGTLLNPNAPVTAAIVEVLYSQALGHAPSQATLAGWLTSGLTIAQAFEDMVTSQSYFATTQSSIEQYLTAAAINEAGLTTINGTHATGALTLGAAAMPLTHPNLTVLGGSGATTITADGAADTINLGMVSTGTSITSAQTVHTTGAGSVITFATTAADGTAVSWAGASSVDGGNSSTGIGVNDTVNFGNNTGSGSETVVVTADLTGATTSGGTSTAGIAMTILGHVVDGDGDLIVFDNAATELLAGTNAVNVSSASSLAHAIDMAAAAAAASQSGGMIGAHTSVIDWFQYSGNTYMVEAINTTGSAAAHNALAATDEVIKILGLVNLSGETLGGHTLTL